MRTSYLLALLALTCWWHSVAAQPERLLPGKKTPTANAKVPISGIYSDLKYLADAGDLGGMEVFLVYGGNSGYFAFIQCAEGWPGKPVLVAAKVDGTRVELSAHTDPESSCPRARFFGTISRVGLRGTFEGQQEATTLPRKRSYWQ